MKIIHSIAELESHLAKKRTVGNTIGFVPTMGALHAGHLSLIEKAKNHTSYVICCIFLNPTQFNNKEDLEKYPSNINRDILLLSQSNCDCLFIPTVKEIYPKAYKKTFDFGNLTNTMEGKNRPGHFDGVATVVERLFNITKPHKAFFGEKDYQQLAIIRKLTQQLELPIEIIGCPIIREPNGLAMSSRNERLSSKERSEAAIIRNTLLWCKENWKTHTPTSLMNEGTKKINDHPLFQTEYLFIGDGNTLSSISNWDDTQLAVVFTVVQAGKIRLLDNITLFP